jgi:glutamate-1-semialdehyde 2,1-aminomutase
MSLEADYRQHFAKSALLHEQAKQTFPMGVTHDTRIMQPFPVAVERAQGSRKWTVEGHEVIDYFVGHGSHILGHSPADVVAAVNEQMTRGTHYGASHEAELRWGQLVQRLIPSAERVRFTGSGTEATMMALRLARLATGKPRFLKFQGHFHGWHDAVTIGADVPFQATSVPGVPNALAELAMAIPPNDLALVETTLKTNPDLGAVILEPTGGHWGAVPIRGEFLQGLRTLCTQHGAVLIFDEVITGFRVSAGGAQGYYNVTPDMTTLAKILAGGLPGGCVAGRADLLAYLEVRAGQPKMRHPGTYNANPLSAAAGIVTLERIAAGGVCEAANTAARSLRNSLNVMFQARGYPWIAYGDFSMVRVLPGYRGTPPAPPTTDCDGFVPFHGDLNQLDGAKNARQMMALRQGMLLHGVDWWGYAGMTSAVHTATDIDLTVAAMDKTLHAMQAEGLLDG